MGTDRIGLSRHCTVCGCLCAAVQETEVVIPCCRGPAETDESGGPGRGRDSWQGTCLALLRGIAQQLTHSVGVQGPSIDMELSRNSTYDEVCEALTERLKKEGQAEALNLEDPQQLRFTGQQSFSATIPKTAPYKWHGWDALHHVRACALH